MALISSNLVTPQQAALNKKKTTTPLSLLGSAAKTVSNMIIPGSGTAASLAYNAVKPKTTTQSIAPNIPMSTFGTPAAGTQTTMNSPKQPVTPTSVAKPMQPVMPQQNAVAQTPAAPVQDKQTALPQSLLGTILTELISRGKQSATASEDVSGAAQRGYEAAARAREIADAYGREFADIGKQGAKAKAGYLTTGTTPVAQGRAAVVAQTTAAQQQAVAQGAQAALGGVDKELTAANQAANAFTQAGNLAKGALDSGANIAAPIQQPYGNMLVDPVTGQPIQQGGGSIGDAVQLQVQRVLNGTSGYDQAVQALSAYGQAGVNALQQALGPNFNIAQSNANAAAQGQALTTNVTQGVGAERAMNSANSALDKLDAELRNLAPIYKSGVPLTNAIASDIANFLGQNAVSQYQSTLNDARQQVAAVLTAIGASTPTDAMSSARGYLPDGMTPAQQAEKVKAVKELMQQKVDAYKATGNIPQYNPAGGGAPVSGFNW